MEIYKGDAIKIPFIIKYHNTTIDNTNSKDVEISIGSYIKSYKNGEITCVEGKWMYPLTQEETFGIKASSIPVQVRILFPDGTVKGINLPNATIIRNISNEVLT